MESKRASKRKQKNLFIKGGQLSKGQKKHLKEYGELHPVDVDDTDENEQSENKILKKKKVERIIDESLKSHKKAKKIKSNIKVVQEKTQDAEDEEDIEEVSPYQQLMSSFGNGNLSTISQLKKKAKKLPKKVKDMVGHEEEVTMKMLEKQKLRKGEVEAQTEEDSVMLEDPRDSSDSEEETCSSTRRIITDPFSLHFEIDLEENIVHELENRQSDKPVKGVLNAGNILHYPPLPGMSDRDNTIVAMDLQTTPEKLWVKPKLCKTWEELRKEKDSDGLFTPLQREVFPILNSYQDVVFSNRNFNNADEIREMYCLHALNHILKTRSRIVKNNAKIVQAQKEKKELSRELRDHGLTRPKVLIMVPFRDAALKIVNIFIKLLTEPDQGQVMNKKRFFEEFGESDGDSGPQNKPDDFQRMFAGNTDDFFRVGMVIMRKSIKLFAEFYSSDIIIASPVGLRSIIGAEGEKKRDYDFLSSIEVLILDQADVFLMQNWEHVQHVFEHLHLQPKDSHEVDFSRVRMWNLNGWSKFYRQTVVFSSFMSPEINFVFNKHCCNYSGKAKISPSVQPGSVCQVVVQMPQVFHKVSASSHKEIAEKRFEFFVNKIFPELKGATGFMSHTAIFISSYFDFVRVRNYLKKEEVDFLQLSEYTSRANISRSRNSFLQGTKPLLLFTERFYFYYRYRIRGIKNIIFYELPYYPQFYSEIVNYMETSFAGSVTHTNASTSTVLYSKFDVHKLSRVVGSHRCQQMLTSEQTVHMFVTGDQ